ncbi:MAG: response regulator, partial [Planctomycetota bacterium]
SDVARLGADSAPEIPPSDRAKENFEVVATPEPGESGSRSSRPETDERSGECEPSPDPRPEIGAQLLEKRSFVESEGSELEQAEMQREATTTDEPTDTADGEVALEDEDSRSFEARVSEVIDREVQSARACGPSPSELEELERSGLPADIPIRAIEVADHGIAILDAGEPGIPVIWSNQVFRRMNGIQDRPAVRFEHLRPDGVDFRSWGRLRLALSRGIAGRELVQCARSDGSVFPAEIRLSPIPARDAEPQRFVCVQTDVSQRASLENELRESEARFRVIAELVTHLTYGCHVIDGAIKFGWFEGQVATIIGCEPETLIELGTWRHLIHVDDQERVEAHYNALLEGRESEVEFRMVQPRGSQRWILDHARPVHDSRGHVVQVIGAARDITEKKRRVEASLIQEEEGRRIQRMDAISRLAGGVAHDFNNLLTTILGNASLVQTRLSDRDDATPGLVDEVVAAARQASDLTHQLLAFAERQVLRPESLDLNHVVGRAAGMLDRMLPPGIDLFLDRVDGDLGVHADRSQIEQIVLNLGLNAYDALEEKGSIRIETQAVELDDEVVRRPVVVPAGRYARLSVIDDGIGFDESARERIFEPFYTTKDIGEGRGLGLATVYGIVRQSGGLITVDSAPGCGARFDVYFPLEASDHVMPVSNEGENAVVLVVEDEPGVRRLLCQVLGEAGYQVLEAENGARALEVLRGNGGPVDLLVTDVVMPEINGRDLAQRVRSAYPETRILFVSGHSYDAIAQGGVLDHDVEFLQKPFVPETLAEKVRELLAS